MIFSYQNDQKGSELNARVNIARKWDSNRVAGGCMSLDVHLDWFLDSCSFLDPQWHIDDDHANYEEWIANNTIFSLQPELILTFNAKIH